MRTLLISLLCALALGAHAVPPTAAKKLAQRHIDFNGDGRSDVAWRTSSQSTPVELWSIDGNAGAVGYAIAELHAFGTLERIADFNGDGKSDLLWRDFATESYTIDLLNGVLYPGQPHVLTRQMVMLPASGWKVVAVGDFNADGKADLVWRRTSDGAHGLWLMDGVGRVPGGSGVMETPGPGYSIAFLADFNGDAKSDVLWQHTDGRAVIALMDGPTIIASSQPLGAGTGWVPKFSGDFNGDGKADLVWAHTATRREGIWLMDGTSFSPTLILGPDSVWYTVAAGDLDGDGKDDLVLATSMDCRHGAWLMDGASIAGYTAMRGVYCSLFIRALGDYDGDGKTDILWETAPSPYHEITLANGLALGNPIGLYTGLFQWYWDGDRGWVK